MVEHKHLPGVRRVGMTDGFGHWLAGFIDGEGCFHISPANTKKNPGWRAGFKLCVRADDEAVVREIHETTGIGRVRVSPHSGGRPQARWEITSKGGCRALVDLLDRFPLRAKKARDYAIWREAVLIWHRDMYQGSNPADWSEIGALRDQLMEQRTYEWFERTSPVTYVRAAGVDGADASAAAGHTLDVQNKVYTHSLGRSFEAMRRAVGE